MITKLYHPEHDEEFNLKLSNKKRKFEISTPFSKEEYFSLNQAIKNFYEIKNEFINHGYLPLTKTEKIKIKKKHKNNFKFLKPKTKENHIGIEIEFICPYPKNQLAVLLAESNIANFSQLQEDGTIFENYTGFVKFPEVFIPSKQKVNAHFPHELCLLIPESRLLNCLNKVQFFLKEIKAKVNNSCSVHVHLDMRNRNVNNCFKKLVNKQDFLFRKYPKKSLSIFCQYVQTDVFQDALMLYSKENEGPECYRYLSINPHSYKHLKTLEVRIMEGSTDMSKVYSWVNLLRKIIKE